jgi:hypothetical protein
VAGSLKNNGWARAGGNELPDTRTHRGPHPEDVILFGPAALPALREGTADFCWLLDRGYASASAVKLVGDRYRLAARQRTAMARAACSQVDQARRKTHQVDAAALVGRSLFLDGYNVLTTVEAAMAGGVILAARDGTYRDMASMHGSFRLVAETRLALERIGRTAAGLGVSQCVWYLDRPVSNSGRLKTVMAEVAAMAGWPWAIELVSDPDAILRTADQVIATADSAVLDRCRAWFNLARETVSRHVPEALVVDL